MYRAIKPVLIENRNASYPSLGYPRRLPFFGTMDFPRADVIARIFGEN